MATVKKVMKSGASTPAKKLKKAQNGTKEEPTYKGLQWVGTPTKKDSIEYKKGFYEGIEAKKQNKKNTSTAFGTSPKIRGYNEGYKK